MRFEIIQIFEFSLIHNHYESRKKFVRTKVKTALAEAITITKNSLSEFKLSIRLDPFFKTYEAENNMIHYNLVDDLWDSIAPIYEYKDKENQLEDCSTEITNLINTLVNTEIQKIHDIYV